MRPGYFHKETEYRISTLANDIQKVIAHSRGGIVTEADIAQSVNGDLDTFVFNFLDYISMGRKDMAFSLLHNILTAGSDVYAVTGLLVNHFELMLEIRGTRKRRYARRGDRQNLESTRVSCQKGNGIL